MAFINFENVGFAYPNMVILLLRMLALKLRKAKTLPLLDKMEPEKLQL